jgi:hypothetical protein
VHADEQVSADLQLLVALTYDKAGVLVAPCI